MLLPPDFVSRSRVTKDAALKLSLLLDTLEITAAKDFGATHWAVVLSSLDAAASAATNARQMIELSFGTEGTARAPRKEL